MNLSADPGHSFGFTERWFTLGVVSDELLSEMRRKWDTGDDPNPEHYRYGAFQEYLTKRRPLSPEVAISLYELGDTDPDESMGGAMMADILRLPECPPNLFDAAAESGRKHLVRIVERRNKPKGQG